MDLFLFLTKKKGDYMNDESAIAVKIIRAYLRELKYYELHSWIPSHTEQIIYQEIAATKLLNYIKDWKWLRPTTIIENFKAKMDQYACMNEHNSRHFSIQADAATYILDEIIVYKERRENQNGQNKIRKVY